MRRFKVVCCLLVFIFAGYPAFSKDGPVSFEQYLRESAVTKNVLDVFLDPEQYSWAQFDPDVGYRVGYYMPRDGIDGSSTISTAQANGARTGQVYAGKPCRINTYGNSFTQCHQVSDGETWQEYLAAHLGEPIRNFGVGGYGVYQSYRRMLKEENTDHNAEYIIFYIWGDDHVRSLLRCRHALIHKVWDHDGGRMFHNNFWPNIEMNMETGEFIENDNLLPTPESLYKMTDPDWMVENLKTDLALRISLYLRGFIDDIDIADVQKLAGHVGMHDIQLREVKNYKNYIERVLTQYSFEATKYILKKVRDYTEKNNKKLLVVLLDPSRVTRALLENRPRYDQEIVDFLKDNQYRYFDMNVVHAEDFKAFKLSSGEYMMRYYIGHYNPAGNHFFAYSIKDMVVDWLDPKPVTYQDSGQRMIRFKGYLPEY